MTTEQIQARTALGPVLRQLADVLDNTTDVALPTPCAEYDVAALRAHTIGWLTAFTDGFGDPNGNCSDPDDVTVRGTGADQVRELAATVDTALTEGAAARPLRIGGAEMPGPTALQMILWEYQVHGWDLAKATGQSWSPAEDGLRQSLAFAPMMLTSDYQGEGKPFAPRVDVPESAPLMDQLVGLSGRDPQWAAR